MEVVFRRGHVQEYFRDVVLSYDGDECLYWPYARNGGRGGGYGVIGIGGRTYCVHRRVCEEINGTPPTPGHEASHSCGNGHLGCVTKRHLSWKTRAENQADRHLHGTLCRGERNGFSKLSEQDVLYIRQTFSAGDISKKKLARMFDVSTTAIRDIINRKRWKYNAILNEV